jgi:hypothetical protein
MAKKKITRTPKEKMPAWNDDPPKKPKKVKDTLPDDTPILARAKVEYTKAKQRLAEKEAQKQEEEKQQRYKFYHKWKSRLKQEILGAVKQGEAYTCVPGDALYENEMWQMRQEKCFQGLTLEAHDDVGQFYVKVSGWAEEK